VLIDSSDKTSTEIPEAKPCYVADK